MESQRVKLGYGDDDKKRCKEKVHVVAVPYPAQGHIVPLMQLCKKLASEEGVMVTFVNTMHNHARILQADQAAGTRETQYEHIFNIKKNSNSNSNIDSSCMTNNIASTCTHNSNFNSNLYNNKSNSSKYPTIGNPCASYSTPQNSTTSTNTGICNTTSATTTIKSTEINPKSSNSATNIIPNRSTLQNNNSNPNNFISTHGNLNDNWKDNNNIRLVGIPGGLPPELHGDPAQQVAAFQASEALCGPLEKLLEKLNQEGPPVSCIISDVLMSWTQECADKLGVPRFAFWTSSAAVYHVICHMYGLISKGIPTFKATNTIFEDNNTEMVSCIPGLPPMDLNDLPIIVRSDPADFIYQFLTRQLKPMERAAAVLINTFYELEENCLQALPATSRVPIYSIGPLLPLHVILQANVDGESDGVHAKHKPATKEYKTGAVEIKHAAADKQDCKAAGAASGDGKVDGSDGKDSGGVKSDGGSVAAEKGESKMKTFTAAEKGGAAAGKAVWGSGKAVCAVKASRKAAAAPRRRSAGMIFSEDVSCIEWLDKKEPGSVLYISFGSIFAMSLDQFTELAHGLQSSKQSFLWSIRPGFVHGTSNYSLSLPPSFLHDTHSRGLLVSWVPQLTVLSHPSIAGFLTHCGWNSTLESVALGVPMLCWPDVGERRTNGRLAVSSWQAGLEFSCSPHMNGLLISREEVKRVILLLMDPCSPRASQLRSKAASLHMSARLALSHTGSSSHDWNRFLDHIQLPNC